MRKNKLLNIIETLDDYEQHQFSKFIISPYFNKKNLLVQLWKMILNEKTILFQNELDDIGFIKRNWFENLFPNKDYNDGAMRKLISELTKLLEKFLIIEYEKSDEWHNKKMLLQCYGRRNLKKEFDQTMVDLKENIHLAPINHHDSSLELFEINQIYYRHPLTEKLKNDNKKLTEGLEHLDQFYISSKLHYSSEQLNRQNIFNKKYQIPLLKEVRTHLQKTGQPSKQVQLYLELQYLLEDGYSLARFSEVEQLYEYCYELLTFEKRHANLLFMINILTRAISKGHTNLVSKILELYEFGIQQNILIQNKRISHETFTNIIVYAAGIGNLTFVEKFIDDYAPYLDSSIRETAIEYCNALIDFYSKNYSDVILKMENYSNTQELFVVRAKSLMLRALVEQYISDPRHFIHFENKVKTIDRFFRRKEKELGTERIKGYLKLLSFSKKLVNLLQNCNASAKDWTKLKSKIENEKVLYARRWLFNLVPNET